MDLHNSNNLIGHISYTSNNLFAGSVDFINLTSNNLNTKINYINTDTIPIGSTNRFISNDIYNRDLVVSGLLTASNLKVIGDTTTLNTTLYQTEQLQVINDSTATAIIIKQTNINQNVAEYYYNNSNIGFIINSSGNVGIGISNPLYKLDVNGNINSSAIFINNNNILTTITNTSNSLINQDTYNSNNLFKSSYDINSNSSNNLIQHISYNSNNIYNIINNSYCKKTSFYFNTTNSFIYNGMTYYTYNIILNNFVRFIQLDNDNISFAKFRIHTSLLDCYFNSAEIKESEYLIMISNRNYNDNTGGLNVRAIGTPQDTYLQKIQPWKVVKSSSINYITYISPVQNASILCTIIDEA
jgi:hypothetical protein